jgi:hypothetical protein
MEGDTFPILLQLFSIYLILEVMGRFWTEHGAGAAAAAGARTIVF